jgi:hypothetical protein
MYNDIDLKSHPEDSQSDSEPQLEASPTRPARRRVGYPPIGSIPDIPVGAIFKSR